MPALTTAEFNAQMLAAVRQAMIGFISDGGQRTVSIGGVSFSYATMDELSRLETMFASRCAADELRAQGKTPWAIGTRMAVR